VALRDEQLAHVPADLGLASAGEPLADDGGHGGIGGRGGRAQAVDLLRALHSAQGAHGRTRLDELRRVEHGAHAEREARPHLVLERHPQRPRDDGLHEANRIVGLVPGHDGDLFDQLAHLVTGQRLLEPWQEQDRLALGRDDQAGEPFQGRRAVAEQVGVVGRRRDEQDVDAALAGLLRGTLHAIAMDGCRESRRGRRNGGHARSLHRCAHCDRRSCRSG
jgi:hypothetical protein